MTTYRALATRALFAARSQINPVLGAATDFAIQCGCVVMLIVLGIGFGIPIGAYRADQRHAESLRRIIPVAEAALVALESEAEALSDTIDALPGVEP